MSMSNPYRTSVIALCAILAALFLGIVIGAMLCSKNSAPAGEWKQAKQDNRVKGEPTQTIKPKDCKVVVIAGAAKEKLELPLEIKQDTTTHITSAVTIPSEERQQSVVTLFNETTGRTDTYTQTLQYPLLAIEQRGQLWLGYGMTRSGQVGRILFREDLLQVKALHLGMNATVDTDGAWFAGVGVGYRW